MHISQEKKKVVAEENVKKKTSSENTILNIEQVNLHLQAELMIISN